MSYIHNWPDILRRAWSVRLMIVAALLTGLEAVINIMGADWMPIPVWARLLIIMLVIGGAFWARIVAQKGLSE